LAVNGLDVYHWRNNEFGSLNFFWCGLLGRACFKIVFCWGWLLSGLLLLLLLWLLLDWSWVVAVVLSVLGDNNWLLLVVLRGVVGGRRRGAAGAAAGAAVIVVAAMELVLDLLLQVVKTSALISLILLLGIVHFGAGGLCLVIFCVLGSGVDVVLSDMLLSRLYNGVLVSRGVGRRENRERDWNSSVKVHQTIALGLSKEKSL